MNVQPQSDWGQTIDQYTQVYDSSDAKRRINLVVEVESPAQAAIARICKLTLNRSNPGVTLSDLKSILELSRSTSSYSFFASPSLVSGCIQLMTTIRVSGKASPFSYKYGYLCFRTMSIALGMCLLKNNSESQLDLVNMYMMGDTETELSPIEIVSTFAAMAVDKAIEHASNPGTETYNCVIGWSHCSEHPNKQDAVSRAEAGTLLAILWDDREMFLKAMANTVSPGLSPVVYLLWRYAVYESYLKGSLGPQSAKLMIPFVEIFRRSYLTIGLDQRRPFQLLAAVNFRDSLIWNDSPKHNHLDDSVQIIRAYNNQIWQHDNVFGAPDLNDILEFIHQHLLPGCDDEIPRIVQATVYQLWKHFIDASGQESHEKLSVLKSICGALISLGEILKSIAERPVKPPAATQIVEMVAEGGLLDLVGRLLLCMKPTVNQLFPASSDPSRK
ncbi:hypothetical protein RSOLAG22IIIB_05103 [Rhizoctonia solani]|uniref:Uncharacterized protein n=1 Tax=Rhizoctonia solani TaxID=456999 RepID=A0A0K6G3N9_9AGAM|nr:hypothetical protein RSOLAG22IIIB_05103 [Rhizoctonia solani]